LRHKDLALPGEWKDRCFGIAVPLPLAKRQISVATSGTVQKFINLSKFS
jgi:hypothetical protein